jgi:hypothetical protein
VSGESADPREGESGAPRSFKTLIRFGNVTYRIGRLRYGHYEVVRILDDARIGTFQSFPCITVTSANIHPAFVLKIAHAAARGASASWIERLALALRGREIVTLQKPRERG